MAEIVVQLLFEKLSVLLTQEASLLSGVRNEVEKIMQELHSMQAFLRDADRRKDSNERVRTWVQQVREAAYDVEDIIDKFVYHMDRPRRGGVRGFLVKTVRIPKNIYYRHWLATRLQETNSSIRNISEIKVRYGLNQIEEGTSSNDDREMWQRDVETSLFKEDVDIVGMKKELGLIDRWLVEEEDRLMVISVRGMGGVGKTTLVTKAYKNQQVKKHFDFYACVSISQTLKIDELLRSIIKQLLEATEEAVPNDLAAKDAHELRRMVRRHLQSKKYLTVLDDVWSTNDWNKISDIFPDSKCGSRLIVTTRDARVGFAMGERSRVCELQSLQQEEAWELFCNKAFQNERCPTDLYPLARSIVEKCEGLPLAIVTMGSLLSSKGKSALEWRLVYNSLSWHLENEGMLQPINRILLLSFYDLPFRLKHCFLYCCMFPEDYIIQRKRLIRLWMAEGFVEDTGKITMEEVAEFYMKELIYHNILQVVETNGSGRVKACRMHDIVREVALCLCDEEKFFMRYNEQQGKGGKVRRMSIHNSEETIQLSMNISGLHSLLVFDRSTSFSSSLSTIVSSVILLRVLNLEGVPIESIPDELTKLFNLRYLNLRNTNVRELPKSFGRLRNLQTLDVRDTKLERLPSGIVKLQKLRHLFFYRIEDANAGSFDLSSRKQVPVGICNITSLQSLVNIEAEEGEIVKQVGNLTQLRRFGISKVRTVSGAHLCDSIKKMKHLVRLSVMATREEETLQLEALSPNPPPCLQKLALYGTLENVPGWFSSLGNLTHLWLYWSKLREEDLLSSLHALPYLVYLSLRKAYEGQQFCFRNGWFPKLKRLYFLHLTQLNQVVIEKGALPSIEELDLFGCSELKTLPEGIEYLTGLQKLCLIDMPVELTKRLQLEDGSEEDCRKVGHIPIIECGQTTDEGWIFKRLK
ncbi:disease resistance protein RPM1-like [Magnolia sinica]|uniref:disease resistance protein RPM1-like n=1 Tax=Magnolia sinica TaxID=86752 RepID=UPI002658A892|nr:disease resistance protein RPM1-like [Magnolia sinica]XP_058082326.1 disease resistance protein RPM1-like [Magnolia sinica]